MSSQQQINLLPDSIRQQCEAGARTGRLIIAIIAGVLLIVVATTHSRLQLERVRENHRIAFDAAQAARSAEQQADALTKELELVNSHIAAYERLAMPLNISSLVATIINELPASVTLETFELEAGERRAARTARTPVDSSNNRVPRVVMGEVTGFALSDHEIAELVSRLQDIAAFESVTLDFSRTRHVRETSAREFRLSFRVDLDVPFIVEHTATTVSAHVEDLHQ